MKKSYIRNFKRKTRIDDILAAQNKGNISHRTDFYFVRINLKGQKSSQIAEESLPKEYRESMIMKI